jgi:uncharacterized membrane protein YhaH (DUF805 family)
MNYYLLAFQKFAQFSGRARRTEYCVFLLVNIAITVMLAIIDNAVSGGDSTIRPLSTVYGLVSLIPGLALLVRRLHDLNISAWGLLILCIPFVNLYYFLLLVFKKGSDDANKFGEPSKA